MVRVMTKICIIPEVGFTSEVASPDPWAKVPSLSAARSMGTYAHFQASATRELAYQNLQKSGKGALLERAALGTPIACFVGERSLRKENSPSMGGERLIATFGTHPGGEE